MGKRKAMAIIQDLKRLKEIATMSTALFSLHGTMGNAQDTKKIEEATRNWRNSWIIAPLELVIYEMEALYGKV